MDCKRDVVSRNVVVPHALDCFPCKRVRRQPAHFDVDTPHKSGLRIAHGTSIRIRSLVLVATQKRKRASGPEFGFVEDRVDSHFRQVVRVACSHPPLNRQR
eukprot:1832487-Rhodomonas_salina.1